MIVLGDGGHHGTVNKDGCQEFISYGTYLPCMDTGHAHLIPWIQRQVGVSMWLRLFKEGG